MCLNSQPKEAARAQKSKNKKCLKGEPRKGLATVMWLVHVEAQQYGHVSEKMTEKNSFKKAEFWMTEKQALDKWTQAELDKHIASGRVSWREAPGTSRGLKNMP